MENRISHNGIITSITKDTVTVNITSNAACGSCAAKSACGMSEKKNKSIEVETKYFPYATPPVTMEDLHVGQNVEVYMNASKGTKAVIIGYLLPFIILTATLIITLTTIKIEWLSAMIALSAVAVYYLIIKMFFNKKLKKDFVFYIKTIE